MVKSRRVRQLNEADVPALVAIEAATQFSPWSEEVFKKCIILGSQGWVIEDHQQAVGFALLFAKVGEGHLLNIGVHPDYQRQGYGQQLMETVIEAALDEGLTVVYLEVRCSNHPAIALYEKMGFEKIGIRKGYYPAATSREDAWIFVKNMPLV